MESSQKFKTFIDSIEDKYVDSFMKSAHVVVPTAVELELNREQTKKLIDVQTFVLHLGMTEFKESLTFTTNIGIMEGILFGKALAEGRDHATQCILDSIPEDMSEIRDGVAKCITAIQDEVAAQHFKKANITH